jgi:hemoglobin-like flavoprotein
MITEEQKQLVKDSWAKLIPIQERAAELFYDRLFAMHPEVKAYFSGDMQVQGRKLMAMLNTAVAGLDHMDQMIGPLKASGTVHAGYGVKEEDYDKVADAFLWTLGQGLGETYTPEIEAAWIATYNVVAGVMKSGAAESTAARSPHPPPWYRRVFKTVS